MWPVKVSLNKPRKKQKKERKRENVSEILFSTLNQSIKTIENEDDYR